MKTVQLIRDKNFKVDFKKLKSLIESKCKYLKIDIIDNEYNFDEKLIVFDKTHIKHRKNFEDKIKSDIVILATDIPYSNNYFIEEYEDFAPVSFYNWDKLTDLPRENGMLYWICDRALSTLDYSASSHSKTTGCINDYLWEKTGIDTGMRQATLCPACLKALLKAKFTADEEHLLKDIKILLNYLAEKSKWGLSIFDKLDIKKKETTIKNKPEQNGSAKRKPVESGIIKVLIASPSDTDRERELLYFRLPVIFQKEGHEKITKLRVIVTRWEDLASQPGIVQEIINKRLLPETDVVVGILRHKLGTPTKKAASGTAEEILYALDKNPRQALGMVYFYSKPPRVILGKDDAKKAIDEYNRVEKFKKKIQAKVLYKPYTSELDLLDMVVKDLAKNIQTYFK